MTTWNCRVVRRKYTNALGFIEYAYGIHEVYYDANGKAGMVSTEPQAAFGDTVLDLKKGYEMQAAAFSKPILDFDAIPEPGYQEQFSDEQAEEDYFSNLTAEELKKIDEENAEFDQELEKFDSAAYYNELNQSRLNDEEKYNDDLKKINKSN